jgi:cytochrome c2
MPDRFIGWAAVLVVLAAGATVALTAAPQPGDLLGETPRAHELLRRYGCAGCHEIPGVAAARGQVGPSLEGLAGRIYLGGVARNTREGLVNWIVDPRALAPHTAMPTTGISREEAQDVADYLRR